MPTILSAVAERITVICSTAKRITDSDIPSAYGITAVEIGSLEEALQQAGYEHTNHLSTKRGSWEILHRQNYTFTPFLPDQNGQLADSCTAIYTGKHTGKDSSNYGFMTAPTAPVNLEEIAKNAQHISSGVIETRSRRVFDWWSRDYSSQGLKTGLIVIGGTFAGILAGMALTIATGNEDTGTGALMVLGGVLVGGGALPTGNVVGDLLTSARMSNAGNYVFGEEVTAALDADLALLQMHQVAAKAYSALTSSGSQMNREGFWEIFTAIQESGFLLKNMGPALLGRQGFGEAARVIAPYAHNSSV